MNNFRDKQSYPMITVILQHLNIQRGGNGKYRCPKCAGDPESLIKDQKEPALWIGDDEGFYCHRCNGHGREFKGKGSFSFVKQLHEFNDADTRQWFICENLMNGHSKRLACYTNGKKNGDSIYTYSSEKQSKDYYLRFIDASAQGNDRFLALKKNKIKICKLSDKILRKIETELGKYYSKETFQKAGFLTCTYNNRLAIAAPNKEFWEYNPNNYQEIIYTEGITDYLTAIESDLDMTYGIISRRQEKTKFIPQGKLNIFLMDGDSSNKTPMIDVIKNSIGENGEYTMKFIDFPGRDFSDFYFENNQPGESLKTLRERIESTPIETFVKRSPTNGQIKSSGSKVSIIENLQQTITHSFEDQKNDELEGYKAAIPPSGFLRDYIDTYEPTTDAPSQYHLFTALLVLSTVIRRTIILEYGTSKIYPNLWCLFLSDSATCRKSTTVNIGQRILNKLMESLNLRSESEFIYPLNSSFEALVDYMENSPQGIFIVDEFSSMIQFFNKSYMKGMIEILTSLYDCPNDHKRNLRKVKINIKQPMINILAASSISWFNKVKTREDLEGGFYSRFLYVPAFHRAKKPIPLPPLPDAGKERALLQFLEDVFHFLNPHNKKITEIPFSFELIRSDYEKFFYKNQSDLESLDTSYLKAYFLRLEQAVLKIAILYDVSLKGIGSFNERSISSEAFHLAEALIEYLKRRLLILFENEIEDGDHWFAKKKKWLTRTLRKNNGKIDRNRALRNSDLSAFQFKQLIETMIESGEIIFDEEFNMILLGRN